MSSRDLDFLTLRKTISYNDDGSFVSPNYVFTASTNGIQNYTNNLILNSVRTSSIIDNIGNRGGANQVLTASTIGGSLRWKNGNEILPAGSAYSDYLYYDSNNAVWQTASTSVHIGSYAGNLSQGLYSVAIGNQAGYSAQGQSAVAIGITAGKNTQRQNAIAIGQQAGIQDQGTFGVGVGAYSAKISQGVQAVSVGFYAGEMNQGYSAVAMGPFAGQGSQGQYAIAIGLNAGFITQGNNAIGIGNTAGKNSQSSGAIAIGYTAGQNSQGTNAVAIGVEVALNGQKSGAISIGYRAGYTTQGTNAVAIGAQAGYTNQDTNAVAVGYQAGYTNQGAYAIAIGYQAGQNNQPSNSIVINATTTAISGVSQNALYIKPIRSAAVTGNALVYDVSNSEVVYNTGKTFIIDHPVDTNRYLVHACLEGPEDGIYYRGKGEIAENATSAVIQLPSYVSALGTDFTVHITAIHDHLSADCSRFIRAYAAGEVINSAFTVYCEKPIPVISKFSWIVHGKRSSVVAEPLKSEVVVRGDGPYKWLQPM